MVSSKLGGIFAKAAEVENFHENRRNFLQFVGSPVSCVPLSNQPSGPLARELIVPLNHYNPTVIFMLYKMHYLSFTNISRRWRKMQAAHTPSG